MELSTRLDTWTYETVVEIVRKYDFEPGLFDFKGVLNGTGADQESLNRSIRKTACSMANSGGGFILFGVKDRSAESMDYYEVRDQMLLSEERLRKMILLRLEISHIRAVTAEMSGSRGKDH